MYVCVFHSSAASAEQAGQLLPGCDTAAYHASPLRPFMWAGPTIHRLTLGPGSSHVVEQRACFVGAGVYNLGLLRISAGSADDLTDTVPQRGVSAAPIVIREAGALPPADAAVGNLSA